MISTVVPLAHSDAGTGAPALVYLPGWCGGRDVFDPLLARTAQTHRSVSVDWPGHGDSPAAAGDFGGSDLVSDVVALVDRLGLDEFVPVGLAHAGWTALELRRTLGPRRVPAIVLMDWMPLGPPPGFMDALGGLQDPEAWSAVREQLFGMWLAGVDDPSIHSYVDSMAAHGFEMWSRAGREIAKSFTDHGTPLAGVTALAEQQGTPCPTLHVYAQPHDDGYLAAQQAVSADHDWFRVHRLTASSHFPCLEVPDETANVVGEFVADLA